MITLIFLRLLFVIIFSAIGYNLGQDNPILFAGIAAIVSIIIVGLETFARQVSLKGLSSAVFGIFLGLLIAWVVGSALDQIPLHEDVSQSFVGNTKIFITFVFEYIIINNYSI